MSSFFSKVRDGLAKTAQRIRETLGEAPAIVATTTAEGKPVLTVAEIEDALVGADVGLSATERIRAPKGISSPASPSGYPAPS